METKQVYFWKVTKSYINNRGRKKAFPGYKPMKDRLILLMCGNACGDFKLKPLLVFHKDDT